MNEVLFDIASDSYAQGLNPAERYTFVASARTSIRLTRFVWILTGLFSLFCCGIGHDLGFPDMSRRISALIHLVALKFGFVFRVSTTSFRILLFIMSHSSARFSLATPLSTFPTFSNFSPTLYMCFKSPTCSSFVNDDNVFTLPSGSFTYCYGYLLVSFTSSCILSASFRRIVRSAEVLGLHFRMLLTSVS